jgi:hypothetical protein
MGVHHNEFFPSSSLQNQRFGFQPGNETCASVVAKWLSFNGSLQLHFTEPV